MLSLIKYHTDRKSKGWTFEISRFKSFAACKSVKNPFPIRVSKMGKPNQSRLIKRNLSHLEKNIKRKYNFVQPQDLEQE